MNKKELLGGVKKLEADGGHKPNPADLKAPFECTGIACRLFCTGCGTLVGLTTQGTIHLVRQAGEDIKRLNPPNTTYIEVSRCGCCSDGYKDPGLKLI